MQVSLDRVGKRFGSNAVLDELSIEFVPGEIVALIGLNGAGKTTLMRLLAGIVAPTRGTLRMDGIAFSRNDLATRRRLVFLPDFPPSLPGASVIEHLALVLRLHEREVDPAAVVRVLGDLDLLALAEAPIATLSRGQAYKTALAALILVAPDLWLLDEPFASGMDAQGLAMLKHHARAAAAAGASVIYSTQILEIAERFSHRLLVLDRGAIALSLSAAELAALPRDGDGALEARLRAFRQDQA